MNRLYCIAVSVLLFASVLSASAANWYIDKDGTTTDNPTNLRIIADSSTDSDLKIDNFVTSASAFNPEDIP